MSDPKKIILLEDDKASARMVSLFLESRGYDVQEAHEGRFAIEMALVAPPDLMIVDVLLPDMHGSEVVLKLREKEAFNSVKVLFLTSLLKNGSEEGSESRLNVAGQPYPALSKPFKPAKLAEVVERVLQS